MTANYASLTGDTSMGSTVFLYTTVTLTDIEIKYLAEAF